MDRTFEESARQVAELFAFTPTDLELALWAVHFAYPTVARSVLIECLYPASEMVARTTGDPDAIVEHLQALVEAAVRMGL